MTMTRRFGRVRAGWAAALALLPLAAWAGPLEDADQAYRQGDYRAAITLLEQARQETPDRPQVFAAMGRTYRKLGDDAKALEAYTEFLRLDPDLRTIRDPNSRRAFLQTFQQLGGQVPARAPSGGDGGGAAAPSGEAVQAAEIVAALSRGSVYVVPSLRSEVDAGAIERAAATAAPHKAKVFVTRGTGGYRTREELAAKLAEALRFQKYDVLVVMTPRGVSGYSPALSTSEITQALRDANVEALVSQNQPTEAASAAVRALGAAAKARESQAGTAGVALPLLALGGVGGFLLWRRAKAKREMEAAREPVEALRQRVLADLSYVDGYLDLLPEGPDTTQARQLRAAAFEKYDTATGLLKTAKHPDELRQAGPLLENAAKELLECRQAVDRATGGTGVAMGLPDLPSLDTDVRKAEKYRRAEELRDAEERRWMQQEVEQIPEDERGVSFFSGRPFPASQLVPVTIVIQGHRRTVLATPDEADAIRRGETPQIRVFRDPQTGRNLPWYEYRQYDPYRDYYSVTPVFFPVYVPLYDVTYDYGAAVYDHYGAWGMGGYGWGMPGPVGGVYGRDDQPGFGGFAGGYASEQPVDVAHAGGFDFFGTQGVSEQGDFDTGGGESGGGGFFDFTGGGSDAGSSWGSGDSGSSSSDSGSSSSDSGSFGGGSSDW